MVKILKYKSIVFGFLIVSIFSFMAIFAFYIAPYDPASINVENAFLAPSLKHLFGTDQLGRDIFSRIVYGGRISLSIGFVAVGISVLMGSLIGSISGYYGGKIDTIIMRVVDMFLCFPTFFLILAVVAILGSNIYNIMIIIGVTSWMGVARLIRAEILSLKERDFIQASRLAGSSDFHIITKHLIPNSLTPVLVSATLGVGGAILTEAALSFLGLGVQPPTPSWGNILMDGKAALDVAWWITLFPGIIILITVLGYNLLGEGLRDMMNPRLKTQR